MYILLCIMNFQAIFEIWIFANLLKITESKMQKIKGIQK